MTDDFPRPHHPHHSELIGVRENGQKIKRRVPRMRACDERNSKGKLCAGHLKRWYAADGEITNQFGAEIYRCEHCHTLYLPNQLEAGRTMVLQW